eukprot:Nk52_evm1s501 gene=Nk52_evmTU1s501
MQIPSYWMWAYYASYFRYATDILGANEFSDNSSYQSPSSTDITNAWGFNDLPMLTNFVIMLLYVVVFRLATLLSFSYSSFK